MSDRSASGSSRDDSGALVQLTAENQGLRRRIGSSLSQAFHNEPNFTYLLPDPKRRVRGLSWFFGEFVTGIGMQYGVVDVAEHGAAAAVWLGPGERVTAAGAVSAGLLRLPLHLGLQGAWRSQRLGGCIERERQCQMSEAHWYLMALGVAPDRQGNNVGGSLLSHGIARAERSGFPCYLETFRSATAGYYKRSGFRAISEGSITKAGPRFITMARGSRSESQRTLSG